MKPNHSILLAFYSDEERGARVLRDLRRQGLRRSAAVQRAETGAVREIGTQHSHRRRAAMGLAIVAGLMAVNALVLFAAPIGDAARWIAGSMLGFVAILVAWLILRRVDIGFRSRQITGYQHWVVPGESLVLVSLPSAQVEALLDQLRGDEGGQPVVFVVRAGNAIPPRAPRSPRKERLSTEQIKRHAVQLAVGQRVAPSAGRTHLIQNRIAEADRAIDMISADLARAAQREQSVSLAAEWLLDNAYLIQRHISEVRRNLSESLYDALPVLTNGPRTGESRAYVLASDLVALTDAELVEHDIEEFLLAYEGSSPLSIAELWAMPLMLRVALVQTLAERAIEIGQRQYEHEWADLWANRLLNVARRDPDQLMFALAELARQQPTPSRYVVNRLVNQLQGEPLAFDAMRAWLEHKVGAPIAEAIQEEERDYAYDQVTLANAIGSLRLLAHLDWREVFERVSATDRVLSADPAGIYSAMDFATRDRYRRTIEEIARRVQISELTVAHAAIEESRRGRGHDRAGHVGYFLIDDGRLDLERSIHYRPPRRVRLQRWIQRHPTPLFLGSIGALTLVIVIGVLAITWNAGARGIEVAAFLTIAASALMLGSELAVQIVVSLVTRLLPPEPLPKLSFKRGIPDEWRTLVVVPELLNSPDSVRRALAELEVRYLANQDPNLSFALLVDPPDAPSQEMPDDDSILATAISGTDELNGRYEGAPFLLFVRQRRWSESEQVWMGWERKRGKLEELNRLLAGVAAQSDSELVLVGDSSRLTGIHFVITLDADTQLPHGAAERMIATLAHPLNRPILAPDGKSVSSGYAIIQPRVTSSLPSATATRFSRLMTDAVGTDPYTHVVADVYQDLTGEGSYYGKGIYDAAVLHRVLSNRFPEASILSHDLLEGAHVRVGLASDVELFDTFPGSYLAYTRRKHRWIRGDWQIAAWCTPRIPTGTAWVPNPLSPINRWKILDNLRRSLIPIAAVIFLVTGWIAWPDAALIWSAFAGVVLFFSPLVQLIIRIVTQPISAILFWRRRREWRALAIVWVRAVLAVVFLPHQALVSLDAIARVGFRRLISHRLLLQWQTSHLEPRMAAQREHDLVTRMGAFTVLSAVLMAVIARIAPHAVWPAAPVLVLWAVSPAVLAWMDGRGKERGATSDLSPDQQLALRVLARQTWRYFDDFVGPQSSWLPPDNVQEVLQSEVAERTSPTNIGLWLLSSLTAHDCGYLTIDDLVRRTSGTLETLNELEHCEGHILNWYDIQTLQPLTPRYVSTVDSGNLLASLWGLAQGLTDILERPLLGPHALKGVADTFGLLEDSLKREFAAGTASRRIDELAATLASLCADPPDQLPDVIYRLRAIAGPASELAEAIEAIQGGESGSSRTSVLIQEPALDASARRQAGYWSRQLERLVGEWLDVVDRYLPWVESLASQAGDALDWRQALSVAPSARALASDEWATPARSGETCNWPAEVAESASRAQQEASALLCRARRLIAQCGELADGMNLRFLYDPERRLFTIGFNVETRRLDRSYYDLLASEARIASFVAIARGEVPVDHWMALGRDFTGIDGRTVLLSWSGTMFEYLMPHLIMRSFANSLLDDACRQAVATQIDFAARRRIPWGISESAFAALDSRHIYQYQAFGVPALGIQRGLEDNLVVAPYATALTLGIEPLAALQNLQWLTRLGLRGDYGFYDSIDFTPKRQADGPAGVIVYTYMAHHQGMTLVAIGNALHDNVMLARFHSDPRVRATEPLLWEHIPISPLLVDIPARQAMLRQLMPTSASASASRVTTPHTPTPRTWVLGNGTYSVVVTGAGGGYSRWRDIDLTRWRADTTLDSWGSFCYVKDIERGTIWSTAYQPTQSAGSSYDVAFAAGRVEFERRDAGIGTLTEVAVALEDAAELRRITCVNHSDHSRRLEVTSYTELALAPHVADLAHPAFSKLFIQTASLPERHALLAWRKSRSPDDRAVWAAQVLAFPSDEASSGESVQYETDRARFLGRGRTLEHPAALDGDLSNTTGWVLDPIFGLRCRITLEPGERVQLVFVTVAAETREGVHDLVEKYGDVHVANREFDLARAQAQLEPRQLRIAADDIQQFQQLAGHVLFPHATLRAAEQFLRQNLLGQSRLWAHGISGDLPIVLITIGDARDLRLVREVLTAHSYWRLRGLQTDLVIVNEEAASYDQSLAQDLKKLIQMHAQFPTADQSGGVFLRSANHIPDVDFTLLQAAARVVLVASRGTLAQQLSVPAKTPILPPPLTLASRPQEEEPSAPLPFLELPYFNGLGGFTADGKEYAIYLGSGSRTPAPWVNVMANAGFGALVSETGAGFCWSGNSQSNRLLPWSNDPTADPAGDGIYIRDDDTGTFWSPTAAPIREQDAYRTRHGQGYTVFEHNSHAIEQELVMFVPIDEAGGAPVRVQRLRLRNRSSRRRRLSVVSYAEWVLGGHRDETQMHVVTNWDVESRAIFARNAYHPDVPHRVAFASVSPRATSYTADRDEFLGRHGSLANPAALRRRSLSDRTGAGLDPCAALQVAVEIDPGEETEVIICLGQSSDPVQARNLLRRFHSGILVQEALDATLAFWDHLLGAVQVETPDPAVDLMLNRWLLYQSLSCRIWGRSGFYQSGGAIGFRDQLQDAMALLYAAPDLSRTQILTAAARQFVEGDVQHWWHPQSGAGVRTRISDDLLWLPYVTTQYVRVTGDIGILDEVVPFLEAPALDEDEHERYFIPAISQEHGSLTEHCRRAIAHGLTAGPHGLPLIGTGDWNDGMNLVGAGGRGESVWLAWFLIDVLRGFADLLVRSGAADQADRYTAEARRLTDAVEAQAWDGEWYRRAYFDDGTPLGSRENQEARIDSLPQSWAVISGAAGPDRARRALESMEQELVRERDQMILLFTPPFEHPARDPGYVGRYPPGVRENGGQYTHAAIWAAMAFARQGDGDRATELLRMLNPVEHARTPDDVARYKVEPYVVAADVYALEGQIGRGGWSWYTGSSGWMYRVWIEEILGFRLRGERLTLDPVLPRNWPHVKIRYRHGKTHYAITIENPDATTGGVLWVEQDGSRLPTHEIELHDDGADHIVTVRLGHAA
jgi:cyclic beta-1,2-glucan synthetase